MSRAINLLVELGPLLVANKSGVSFYLDGLLRELVKRDEIAATGFYFDFLKRRNYQMPDIPGLGFRRANLPERLLVGLKQAGLRQPLSPSVTKGMDVCLFTNYVTLPMPGRKTKTALVVYDMGYLDAPEYIQDVTLHYLKKCAGSSIRSADLIITISEFSRSRIEHYFPEASGRIIVTQVPPPEPGASVSNLPSRLSELGVVSRSYILYVGTVEPRKNLGVLLEAYSRLPTGLRDFYSLVIAGGKGWKDDSVLEAIERLIGQGHKIITAGYVSDHEKMALYQNAAAFALPSHYEGFGMPILEAMSYDVPVAVSDIPVFRDVAGDAAVFFDKDDPADVVAKLTEILSNSDKAADLVRRGRTNLTRYSWERNAELVAGALEELTKPLH